MKKKLFINKNNQPAGYTIIELLFAVANFTFILMIAISAFIVVMRVYNKAAFARQTQQAARSVIEQMSGDVRLASVINVDTDPTHPSMCLQIKSPDESSGVKYSLSGSKIIREVFTDTTCAGGPTTITNVTADTFNVTSLVFNKIIWQPLPPSLNIYGTAVRINLVMTKGTSASVSDPFYDQTSFTTLVNARGGS